MKLNAALIFLWLGLVPLGMAQADPVVARVGRSTLTKSQFELQFGLFVRELLQQRGQAYSPGAEEAFAQFRLQFLERMARDRAVILAAEAAGFAAKPAAVEAALEEVKAEFASEEEFRLALEAVGIPSVEAYRRLVYEALTYNAYVESLREKLRPSEPALRLLYLVSKPQFSLPARYCSAHILVATAQEARQVIARLARGEKFADLARELSIDPGSKDQGGDLGCEPRGTFVAPFELALTALKPGESSRTPVRTEFGFHVILLIRVEAAGFQPFDQAREGLAQRVRDAALQKVLDNIASLAHIQLFPENLQNR